MKGRLLEISLDKKQGKVATGNDELGVLTVYFSRITEMIAVGNTIEFEVVTSRFGNKYAKFQSIVDRNTTIFNTEDRDLWYTWGENEEVDFVSNVVPNLRLDIRVNPEKRRRKTAYEAYKGRGYSAALVYYIEEGVSVISVADGGLNSLKKKGGYSGSLLPSPGLAYSHSLPMRESPVYVCAPGKRPYSGRDSEGINTGPMKGRRSSPPR